MSELFHDEVPLAYIRQVFDVMRRASWHRFQVLTKRSERLAQVSRNSSFQPIRRRGPELEERL